MSKFEIILISIIFLLTNLLISFIEHNNIVILIFVIIDIFFIIIFLKIYNRKKAKKNTVKQGNEILNGNYNRRILSRDSEPYTELIIIINELTERLQEEIIKNKKSEGIRKRLLSNISHDIRTPLTSILGYVEVLYEDKTLKESEKNEYYKILINKAKNLKLMIEEIFEMARLESDDITLDFKVYDLAEVLRETIINYIPSIKKEELEMEINIPDKEFKVYADKFNLERALGNIIKNSIQYGKSGGNLGIELISDKKGFYIHIWDNGPGISKDQIPHVFERLYMGNQYRNNNKKNTGLGLAISKNIIEKHNGKITIESIKNKKTTVKIFIPAL